MRIFPNGARVCFIGDSLVAQHHCLVRIADRYLKTSEGRRVRFFNCGTAGGTAEFACSAFDVDTGVIRPTHAVVAFGINDSNRWLLAQPRSLARDEKLRRCFLNFQTNLVRLCDMLAERKIETVLCTSAPYDEYAPTEIPPLCGGSAMMTAYADFVRNLACDRGLALCDYHAYLTREMQTACLYTADRVHPNEQGYSVMAKCFLETQGLSYEKSAFCNTVFDGWKVRVTELRDLYAAECMIIKDLSLPQEEKRSLIAAYLKNGVYQKPYFETIAKGYLTNIDRKAWIREEIDRLWENEILPFYEAKEL